MELPHFVVSGAHSGCNSKLSSIASNDTSLLSMERPAGRTTRGWRSKFRSSRVPTAGRSARVVESVGQDTIGNRPGVSSSCRGGRFRFFSVYALRVDCRQCGVKVGERSWPDCKEQLTHELPMVPGQLGAASLLEGGGRDLPDHLAARPQCGPACRSVGRVAPEFVGRPGDRRRRDPVAAGASLPDLGLPDRRRLQAAVVDRPGADRTGPARFLRVVRQSHPADVAVRVQRPVAVST